MSLILFRCPLRTFPGVFPKYFSFPRPVFKEDRLFGHAIMFSPPFFRDLSPFPVPSNRWRLLTFFLCVQKFSPPLISLTGILSEISPRVTPSSFSTGASPPPHKPSLPPFFPRFSPVCSSLVFSTGCAFLLLNSFPPPIQRDFPLDFFPPLTGAFKKIFPSHSL